MRMTFSAFLVFAFFCFSGCSAPTTTKNEPAATATATEPEREALPKQITPASLPVSGEIDYVALWLEYRGNEAAADSKFLGKRWRVKLSVGDVRRDPATGQYVVACWIRMDNGKFLAGPYEWRNNPDVICYVGSDQLPVLSSIKVHGSEPRTVEATVDGRRDANTQHGVHQVALKDVIFVE